MLFFGNFKKNEITKSIRNKDLLGLNSDINMSINNSDTAIESYTTTKTNTNDEAILPNTESKTNMVHDAIPHYLRAGNFNNSADTNKDENNSPTLQENSRSRSLRSVSSGNLARNTSFKSFRSIQQSQKRSRTNSCNSPFHKSLDDSNLGSSKDPNFTSNSTELMDQFNKKKKQMK